MWVITVVQAMRIWLQVHLRHFIFDDHFLYSHDLFVWSSSDIVSMEKLVTGH